MERGEEDIRVERRDDVAHVADIRCIEEMATAWLERDIEELRKRLTPRGDQRHGLWVQVARPNVGSGS